MIMRSLLPLTLALGLAAPAFAAEPAAPPAPGPWLKQTVDRAKKLAERTVKADSKEEQAWRKEVKQVVDEILDWDELPKRALGKAWEQRSAAEQKEFAGLLRELIEASYESRLWSAVRTKTERPKKVDLKWEPEVVDGATAEAKATVKSDKTSALLTFSLRWDGQRWRVWDVSIDESSTVRTYRGEFRKLLEGPKGYAGLVERMKQRRDEIRAGKGELSF
jgi:phospholipid transport system substrate-binding protein